MECAKNIKVECSSNELMTFYIQQMYSVGNNGLAKALGIHPSKSSRDKARIFDLACQLVSNFGLPPDSVNLSEKPTKVVLEGDYAERVIQALEGKGKVKRKAPAVTEASQQMDLTI
ncbi:TPA: hypothetical protein OTS89_001416 [Proteus mirabilis]|uniref:hypothetical protein n=1 Tax=Proteus sp. G4377 TaxID=2698848 RepID=UPI001377EFFB|nr:hypothetical protein [Proteus sp. G4377]NBN43874.1 hypothetical protein [Proteus sp. G4377]HCT3249662.1 hypothetical protein [Proteus mirabilis]